MALFTSELSNIQALHAVTKARAIEADATTRHLAGEISEEVLLDYMNDTEGAEAYAILQGCCYKDF